VWRKEEVQMMKSTQLRISLFLLFLASLAVPLMADDQLRLAAQPKVRNRIALTPTADSAVVLDDAAIVELEDGERRLRVGYEMKGRESRFFAKVDLAARTYTTYLPDSNAIPAEVRRASDEKAKKNRARLDLTTDDIVYDPPPNCGLPGNYPVLDPCESPCSGNSNAVLTFFDAQWNWLTDTEGNLQYRRFGARGCRWNSFMNGHCWANSNAGGKIWYPSSCNIVTGSPFLDGGSGTIEGRYYNTNGGNQSLTTNARQWLRIDYAAPATWVNYEYSITGEAYTTFTIEFFAWVNGFCSPY
jgi:hypothetical protein